MLVIPKTNPNPDTQPVKYIIVNQFYIYAFSRHFYPKRLTVSALRLYIVNLYQYVFSLGKKPTTFCVAKAMLYHWAAETRTP